MGKRKNAYVKETSNGGRLDGVTSSLKLELESFDHSGPEVWTKGIEGLALLQACHYDFGNNSNTEEEESKVIICCDLGCQEAFGKTPEKVSPRKLAVCRYVCMT